MTALRTHVPVFAYCALALSALADPTLRLYDLRDLASVLPSEQPSFLPTPELGVKVNIEEREKILLRFAQVADPRRFERKASGDPEPGSAVDDFMHKLCGALSVGSTKLAEGVYTVEGEANQHEQLTRLIQDTFNLYRGSYEADIVCYTAKASDTPAVGGSPGEHLALYRARTTMARRVPALLEAIERVSYIEDWTPVVSGQVVGFDPQTAVMEKGVRLAVIVGGADAPDADNEDRPILIRLSGNIADIKVQEREIPGVGDGPPAAFLSLPGASVRSVKAEMNLVPGKPTVVAVVPGFAPGEVIVVSAAVRPIN